MEITVKSYTYLSFGKWVNSYKVSLPTYVMYGEFYLTSTQSFKYSITIKTAYKYRTG